MIKKYVLFLISLVFIGQTLLPASAQGSAVTLFEQLSSHLGSSVQGVIYAVIKDGQQIAGGMGYADKENHILADGANTAFHIGSISKTFVAIAVLQQVEAGHLNLDQDISLYLQDDGFEFQYPITLHDLLTHTAGFEDLISGIAVNDPKNVLTLKESLLRYQPQQFIEPTKVISYSNYGIAVAAYIVEKVSGMSFDAYAQTNIFTPLAMDHTTFDQFQKNIFVSKAYASDLSIANEPYLNLYPEGSVITTANDMLKYMEWCLSDEPLLLSADSKELLFTSQYSGSEDFEGISYTFNIHNYNQDLIVEKKGETAFFNSQLVLYPKQKAALFMSFNTPLPWSSIHSIQNTFSNEMLGYRLSAEKEKITSIRPTGVYQATRSNFTTVERFLNLLIPERTISITRSLNNEYKLNGRPMAVIGENLYDSIIGEVKVARVNDKTVILTDSALSYIEVSNLRDPLWQWTAIFSFIVLLLFNFIRQI
ncbi:MAG: serine hydrolase domain-containing protein, partial [Erysipelotrichaceae bacterium]|nr:serine hydrolase domain-containing protein [Erysipelotrichaceae bacterium]